MLPRASNSLSATIPVYLLYGEPSDGLPPERMHCESIAERSRLYNWTIAPHRHEAFLQILYVEQGRGEALLEAGRHVFSAPCIISVPSMSVHGFSFTRDVQGLIATLSEGHLQEGLQFDTDLCLFLSEPRMCALQPGSADAELVARLFARIDSEFAGASAWRMQSIAASLSLALMTAAGSVFANADPGERRIAGRRLQHLQKFRALVDEHYRSHRQLEFYARALGITATQLNRICRGVLGKSALGIVNDRIVLEAERDLIYTFLEIKNVALSLGFADAAYFSRFFAKQKGQTPTEFRRMARAQLGAVDFSRRDARGKSRATVTRPDFL